MPEEIVVRGSDEDTCVQYYAFRDGLMISQEFNAVSISRDQVEPLIEALRAVLPPSPKS